MAVGRSSRLEAIEGGVVDRVASHESRDVEPKPGWAMSQPHASCVHLLLHSWSALRPRELAGFNGLHLLALMPNVLVELFPERLEPRLRGVPRREGKRRIEIPAIYALGESDVDGIPGEAWLGEVDLKWRRDVEIGGYVANTGVAV